MDTASSYRDLLGRSVYHMNGDIELYNVIRIGRVNIYNRIIASP